MLSKMTKAVALSLILFSAACKKKEEAKAEAKPAETKPTEATPPTPTPAPTPPAADPAAAGLAAIAIPQAKNPNPELLTGGQPTEEHFAMAKEKGVKLVVNLRSAAEEKDFGAGAKKVQELGMKYVHIPIDGKTGDGLNEENAKKLAELLNEKPAIIHCASGQRVGALFGLKAFYVDGKTPEESLAYAREMGLSKPEIEKMIQDQMAAKKKG